MRVVVVEDDYLQAETIVASLKEAFTDIEVDSLYSESDFRAELASFREIPPDAFVIDIMLRWAYPREDSPIPPPDVEKARHYRAGLRCEQILGQYDETRDIPVILYTVLAENNLEGELDSLRPTSRFLGKVSEYRNLIPEIRGLIKRG